MDYGKVSATGSDDDVMMITVAEHKRLRAEVERLKADTDSVKAALATAPLTLQNHLHMYANDLGSQVARLLEICQQQQADALAHVRDGEAVQPKTDDTTPRLECTDNDPED